MKKVFLLILLCPLFLHAQQRVLGPYLQNAAPTSMTVMWETSGQTPSKVSYGLSTALGNEATGGSQTGFLLSRIHTVVVDVLQPGTNYYYSVNYGNKYSDTLMFRTPPLAEAEESFNMVAFSDMQVDLSQPDKFREIVEDGVIDYSNAVTSGALPEKLGFVLVPGDLVAIGLLYPSWKDEFFEPGKQLFSMVPVYPVLGNHEANTAFFFSYFKLPDNGTGGFLEHWWYKDYSNTRIIGLESNVEYISANNGRQKQLNWLDDVLDEACNNEDIDFVFAQLHHPFESELWPDGNNDYVSDVIQRLEDFTTACGKPSIHFFGHTHAYSRGQSRDHQHLMVNVASAGGNLDRWGEYGNQTDYDEFSKSDDQYGFVYLEVEAGDEPKFTLKRINRGVPGNVVDNEIGDSIVVFKDGIQPAKPMGISPADQTVSAQCVLLEANLFQSAFNAAEHGASQWQVTDACGDFSDPNVNIWKQHENWYFNVNTQASDDLTDQEVIGLAPNTAYCWRVRYRDKNLRWSEWSDIVSFRTGSAYNVLSNSGAESGISGWTVTNGNLESLSAGECDSRNPYEGSRFFAVGAACNPAPNGAAHQTVDIGDYAVSVDAGDHMVYFGGRLADYNGTDKPEFRLSFLDEGGNSLGQTPKYGGTHANWIAYDKTAVLPAGARKLKFEIFGTRGFFGVANDSYLDALYLVVDSSAGRIDTTICEGETITLFGQDFDTEGTYTVIDQLSEDCVNEYEVVISLADTLFTIVEEMICQGDSVEVGGIYFHTTGTYFVNDDSGFCPSTIQLNLTVLPPDSEMCVTAIFENMIDNLVDLYPNPFTREATLKLKFLPANNLDLVVYNSAGVEVRRLVGINGTEVKIQRAGLPSGNYLYALGKGDKLFARGMMVIE